MGDDTGLVIGIGIILFLFLYHPPTNEFLWSNDCSNVDGWTQQLSVYKNSFEAYSETYGVPNYALRFSATCDDIHYPQMGECVYSTSLSGIELEPSEGVYRFVLGFRVKIKSTSLWGGGSGDGGGYVYLKNGVTIIGGAAIRGTGSSDTSVSRLNSMAYTSFGPSAGTLDWDKWYDVEVFVSPSGSKVYVNGELRVSDAMSRANLPPTSMEIRCHADSYFSSTEFLLDQIYVKKATAAYLGVE